MASPAYSILIPTRDRPATLRHTLATVAAQPGDDYEIVVADNCSGPDTRKLVESLRAPHVRYTRSEEILPMAENWERGLSLCSGEYVTVLGDDDALVPSALEMARRLVAATHAELISWSPHTYWWPDAIVPWYRSLLIVDLRDGAMEIQSRPTLEQFYDELALTLLPMIYSAFFHRGLIDEARSRYGGFFVPRDAAPDISSGILGLHITETYVHSYRPLSIRGNSGKSNGTAQWARSLGEAQREIYFREERVGLRGIVHPALVPSPNLNIIVASAALKCRETYFPGDERLSVDRKAVLRTMIEELNLEPEAYEENLHDIRALAAKLEVGLDASAIPPKKARARDRFWGIQTRPDGTSALTVNCELAGVEQIAQAAQLVEALMPPAQRFLLPAADAGDPGS